jgi:hypothetical protein
MLLPLFLNNLITAYKLPVDAACYEITGQDINFRIGFPLVVGKQGGAAAMIALSSPNPEIVFGMGEPEGKSDLIGISSAKQARPTIVTVRRKPS